eukprot:11025168-Heterocapsa_arctica.AAC.1
MRPKRAACRSVLSRQLVVMSPSVNFVTVALRFSEQRRMGPKRAAFRSVESPLLQVQGTSLVLLDRFCRRGGWDIGVAAG